MCSPATLDVPGYCRNLGHRDALQTWRNRDADTFKTPAQGVGSILATTRGQTGKGRVVPQSGYNSARTGWDGLRMKCWTGCKNGWIVAKTWPTLLH